MQDIRIRVERAAAPNTVPAHNHGSPSDRRPIHLFSKPSTMYEDHLSLALSLHSIQ